jgi:hypothetical protein
MVHNLMADSLLEQFKSAHVTVNLIEGDGWSEMPLQLGLDFTGML